MVVFFIRLQTVEVSCSDSFLCSSEFISLVLSSFLTNEETSRGALRPTHSGIFSEHEEGTLYAQVRDVLLS